MRFSIIVPVYNTEKYLDKCIKSVLRQTYSDYELILIDDCSTDNSLKIAKKYKYDNIKIIINEINSGLSSTRNVGIKNANGDYIVFLDSDDYIEEDALDNLNKLLYENNFPDIVYTGFKEERGNVITTIYGYASESNKMYTRYYFLKSELERRTLYAAACFGIYKRQLIVDNKLFFKEGIYHEDELWTPQIINAAENIYLSDLTYYHYLRREDSITKVKDKTQNGIDLLNSCYDLIEIFKNMDDNYLRKLMYNHIAMLYMKAMSRGKLYRKEYIKLVNRKLPIRYAYTFIDRIKAILFLISPFCYYLLDQKFGDNEL